MIGFSMNLIILANNFNDNHATESLTNLGSFLSLIND